MQQQEKQTRPQKPHNVIMENRKRVSLTGVLDIDSFNEQGVIVLTQMGSAHSQRRRSSHK